MRYVIKSTRRAGLANRQLHRHGEGRAPLNGHAASGADVRLYVHGAHTYSEPGPPGICAAFGPARAVPPPHPGGLAETSVTALYHDHALGLIRLAHLMLGDRPSAEDVVQDAFCALYRRWGHLSDPASALRYVRTSVLNGCRTVLRKRARRGPYRDCALAASAETAVLDGEERREVMRAVRRLPRRQREALVLRFYLDLPDQEIAATMGISQSSVRSATHRALAALGRALKESS